MHIDDTEAAPEPERRSRRDLLRTAGLVAGAAAAGRLVGADTAAAADGGSFTLGQANAATSKTSLTTSGVVTGGDDPAALSVKGSQADYGISGSGASYGVVGSGIAGVLGLGTVGGVFSGTVSAVNLDPRDDPGPPTSGQALKGDLVVDSTGVLWLCVAEGNPGTWIRVSHGGTRLLATPQRPYSSTEVPPRTRMNRGETRTIPLAGVNGTGVPANAIGVVLNLTVHQTISAGFLSIFPAGSPVPLTSSINWFQSNQQIANGATIGLGTGGAVSIYCDGAIALGEPLTHVIVDVTGYVL